jgi:hypothetical protein
MSGRREATRRNTDVSATVNAEVMTDVNAEVMTDVNTDVNTDEGIDVDIAMDIATNVAGSIELIPTPPIIPTPIPAAAMVPTSRRRIPIQALPTTSQCRVPNRTLLVPVLILPVRTVLLTKAKESQCEQNAVQTAVIQKLRVAEAASHAGKRTRRRATSAAPDPLPVKAVPTTFAVHAGVHIIETKTI